MEKLAIKEAMRSVTHMGTSKIIVRSDSQVTIKTIHGQSPVWKLIENLIEDTRSLVRNSRNIIFCYYNRKLNMLTDILEKKGTSLYASLLLY